ncbi:unnamed protein product [Kuraishia capsulata CBS 1993]|uniref:Uncharacterized protein n=1 Tax=Kuraishia capsulata CBS 1993 TaxID=1382522 RepID=W6MVA1_9ASCO|nr:uncharacterized protein KUCA_T00005841001 [Kuraishia capsulata CBS 1993]CDK29847.1 unnamed protein product [Kuraishia capsulata CBS 1993]
MLCPFWNNVNRIKEFRYKRTWWFLDSTGNSILTRYPSDIDTMSSMDSLHALGVQFTPAELAKLKAVLFPEEPLESTKRPKDKDKQLRVVSDSKIQIRIPEEPRLPVDEFVKKVETLNCSILETAEIIGDKSDYVSQVQSAIIEALTGFSAQIEEEKNKLDEAILKKLDNCIQMHDILEGYNLELMMEPTSQRVSRLLHKCQSSSAKITTVIPYLEEDGKLCKFYEDICLFENSFTPIFKEKAMVFGQKCHEFWSWVSIVFDYKPRNAKLVSILPNAELSETLANSESNSFIDVAEYLPSLVAMSPLIVSEVEEEINAVIRFAQDRTQELAKISEGIMRLYNALDFPVHEQDSRVVYLLELAVECPRLDASTLLGVNETVGLSRRAIDELQQIELGLKQQKAEKELKLQALKEKCMNFWSILDEDEEYVGQFMRNNNDLSDKAIHNFELEIERLQVLKMKHISKFIKQARTKIQQYWDALMYSEDQRRSFGPFWLNQDHDFTEELLQVHETEILNLRDRMAVLQPILESIAELQVLLEEKAQLEQSCKDPNRLRQRNSFKILREEERTRERLKVLLPKTTNGLRDLLVEYESDNGYPFTVDGQSYLVKLEQIEAESGINGNPLRRSTRSRQTPVRPNSNTRTTRSMSAPRMGSSAPPTSARSSSVAKQPRRTNSATRTMSDPFLSRSVSPIRRNLNNSKATLTFTNNTTLRPASALSPIKSEGAIYQDRKPIRGDSPSRLRPPSASVLRSRQRREQDKENEIMTLSPVKPTLKMKASVRSMAAPEILSSDDEDDAHNHNTAGATFRPVLSAVSSNWANSEY